MSVLPEKRKALYTAAHSHSELLYFFLHLSRANMGTGMRFFKYNIFKSLITPMSHAQMSHPFVDLDQSEMGF